MTSLINRRAVGNIGLAAFAWNKEARTLTACASDLGWTVGDWPGRFPIRSCYTGETMFARKTGEDWRGEDDDRQFVAMVYTIRVPGKPDITVAVYND